MLVLWTSVNDKLYKKFVKPSIAHLSVHVKKIPVVSKPPILHPGDVCLAFGGKAVKILQDHGLIPKNRTVGSLRGKPLSMAKGKAQLMITYNPKLILSEYARKPDILWDIKLAARLITTGSLKPTIGDYEFVNDYKNLISYVNQTYALTGKPVPLATDLETMGLVCYEPDKHIVSISFTYLEGQASVRRFINGAYPKPLTQQIKWLLTTPKVAMRGANLKFDKGWFAIKWGIECINDTLDTLLIGSLLDENRSNTLESHAKTFTTMGGYDNALNKKYDKGHMELVPDEELLPYAGGDTDATFRTANVFKTKLIKDKRLVNFYQKLVHPASKMIERVERRGMLVDIPRYHELKIEVQGELKRLSTDAFGMMPRRLRLKYSNDLKLTRDVILREFLFTPKGLNLKPEVFTDKEKLPSCSMKHLELFKEIPEAKAFIDVMREYNSAKKTLDTYIVGFMKHLRPDSRFHTTYILHKGDFGGKDAGTITGRVSCKDPAYQTIPSHTKWAKKLRSVYVPPPGYVILNWDFSQGELRVAADIANEENMIKAYSAGLDLHAITAAQLSGYSLEDFFKLPEALQKELRSGGKAGNFGFLYGMGWKGFVDYAKNTYGFTISESDAQRFRELFLYETWPRLSEWHKEYYALAHKQGYIRSPLGRIRHLPLINSSFNDVRAKAERQSINSPVQSTLSDMSLLSMVRLERRYPELQMFGMTHDSISAYVPEDEVDIWVPRGLEVMENLPLERDFGWTPKLKFIADAEVGIENLGALKEYKIDA